MFLFGEQEILFQGFDVRLQLSCFLSEQLGLVLLPLQLIFTDLQEIKPRLAEARLCFLQ